MSRLLKNSRLEIGVVGSPQAFAEGIHDHQREGWLLADQIDKPGMIDPHHPRVVDSCDGGCGTRRGIDNRHLAEELTLAERCYDVRAALGHFDDADTAAEHDKQLTSNRTFLEDHLRGCVLI